MGKYCTAVSPSSRRESQVLSLPHSHTRVLLDQLPAPYPWACTAEVSQGSGRMQSG